MIASRISGEKTIVAKNNAPDIVQSMHLSGQKILLDNSRKRLHQNTVACATLDDVGNAIKVGKFALYAWDKDPKMEQIIKDRWKATTRCIPFVEQFTDDILEITDDSVPVIIARNF